MSVLKKLVGQVATYGVSSILARAANFLLLPLHTAVFSPSHFAETILFFTMAGFMNIIYTMGMETAFFRFTTKEGADRKVVFESAQTLLVLSSLVLSLFLIFFREGIASLWGLSDPIFVVMLAVVLMLDSWIALPFAKLRLENKAKRFAIYRAISIFLNVGFNAIFLMYLINKDLGRFSPTSPVAFVFLASVLSSALTAALFVKFPLKFVPRLNPEFIKPMLIYSLPVMVTGLAGMANEMIDRPMLENLLPENFYPGKTSREAMGIYSASFKLSVFMTLVIQAFRYAAEPYFFAQSAQSDSKSQYARIMLWFVIVCSFIFLALSVNLHFLQLFITREVFREGIMIVPILLIATMFLGVYYNLSIWFKLADKTYIGTFITIIGATITLVGNILLIPIIGYFGAAITHMLCYGGMMLMCYFLGRKYYPIPYQTGRIIGYISIAIVLYTLFLMIKPEGFWMVTLFALLPVACFIYITLRLEKIQIGQLRF